MVWAVSRETEERLAQYVACLRQWNPTINLMSARDLADVWSRHIPDGLAVAALLAAQPGAVADLGTGGGIPGLVASIVTGRAITLIESDRRKAAFLIEAVRMTGASAIVRSVRVEQSAVTGLAVVSARALAPLSRLLDLSLPMLDPTGCGLFVKGAGAEQEVRDARRRYRFTLARHHVQNATILQVSDIVLA